MSYGKKSHSFQKKSGRDFGGSSGRSGRGFSRPSFGSGRSSRLELTSVTCAACGKKTEVPFKPTGDKPVYCRDCFQNNPRPNGPRPNRHERREQSSISSEEFDNINDKLDKIMQKLGI